ncbi:MAG: methyltransferase domain-containing protein [Planctomycetes bacterium]|nr:methyltransferase domain-containing protein [Planctomycetota bacterium]
MTGTPGCGRPWWERAFGPEYLQVYAHRDDRLARDEVEGLLPRLRSAPGPILDVGCGNGRHLEQLAAAGLPSWGFDYSEHLLEIARERAACRGRLARSDMRHPAFAPGWGAIVLLFTAFGYFDDAENAACLAALGRLLAPGGWLLVDLPDSDHVRRSLVPESRRMTAAGVEIVERRRIDGDRMVKDVGCDQAEYHESVRLYAPAEISAMVEAAEMRVVDIWSSLRGPGHDDRRRVFWITDRYSASRLSPNTES